MRMSVCLCVASPRKFCHTAGGCLEMDVSLKFMTQKSLIEEPPGGCRDGSAVKPHSG